LRGAPLQKVVPMLPRLLCEELCSLNPGVERFAFSGARCKKRTTAPAGRARAGQRRGHLPWQGPAGNRARAFRHRRHGLGARRVGEKGMLAAESRSAVAAQCVLRCPALLTADTGAGATARLALSERVKERVAWKGA